MNEAIAERVKMPALLLLTVGILSLLSDLAAFTLNLMGTAIGVAEALNSNGVAVHLFSGVLGFVLQIFSFMISVYVTWSGTRMLNLKSHTHCTMACILCCIPCCGPLGGPCCLLPLLPGIWGLMVLTHYEVKAAFRS